VFKPLSSYRDSWDAKQNVATVSGVFRVLSEDIPSRTKQDLTTSTVYVIPSEPTARTESAVTKQKQSENRRTSSRVAENTQTSDNKASETNPVTVKTSEKQRPVYQDNGSELSKRNDTKNPDSSEAECGESEPSGDIQHHKVHPPGSVSEALVGSSTRDNKLEYSSSLTGSEEHKGMHHAARDTGQQHGFSLSVVSPLSRASSPGTNSSSGSAYNFLSTTEATGDSNGLRETPMGSTTGLLPDNSSACSQSKLKVSADVSMLCKRYLEYDSLQLQFWCIWWLQKSVIKTVGFAGISAVQSLPFCVLNKRNVYYLGYLKTKYGF
jgi:hypothetical protein